jgi:hypothetical protein
MPVLGCARRAGLLENALPEATAAHPAADLMDVGASDVGGIEIEKLGGAGVAIKNGAIVIDAEHSIRGLVSEDGEEVFDIR